MGDNGIKPYTTNAINEKLERLEPELNDSKYELMRVDEACEKIPDLACSSKNVARDILRSLASFTDFSAGVKKRLLCEVIHKIKVDSKNEVHLFLRPPQRLEPLGLTVQRGVPNRISLRPPEAGSGPAKFAVGQRPFPPFRRRKFGFKSGYAY
jgi:hypothetical protein